MQNLSIDDLLNQKLDDIELGPPLKAAGLYKAVISSLEIKENNKKTGNNLYITSRITGECKDDKGNHLTGGNLDIVDIISLVPTDAKEGKSKGYVPAEKLKQFRFNVTGELTGTFAPLEQYIGVEVAITVVQEKGQDDVIRNRIKSYAKLV